ncbi:MAG: galactokinase [Caldithrix sp.]|nr:galactokinase [Caldithrix sp.]
MSRLEKLRSELRALYGNDNHVIEKQMRRYSELEAQFEQRFADRQRMIFSTPGRTEIGGNHTDHNHGRVLAAGVNLDSIAIAAPVHDPTVTVYSEGYKEPFKVDLTDLTSREDEKGTTSALIRGIAARFAKLDFTIGGFNACMTSDVLPGSGLSSSASVEVLIGTIFSALYNDNRIQPQTIAQTGQYAENEFFGKPCGLMDQMACAVGGILSIDFADPEKPQVRKLDFDFSRQRYSLVIVDSGGSHADLTEDYAAVPAEMKKVAGVLGEEVLRDIDVDQFMHNIPDLRQQVGDRAVLRALHFIEDNERVVKQVQALQDGDFQKFLQLVQESGNSSFKWLQNIYTPKKVDEQGVSLALALSDRFIGEIAAGACRVHGGGFAGTIQAFLPDDHVQAYVQRMETVFGKGCATVLMIRNRGLISFEL